MCKYVQMRIELAISSIDVRVKNPVYNLFNLPKAVQFKPVCVYESLQTTYVKTYIYFINPESSSIYYLIYIHTPFGLPGVRLLISFSISLFLALYGS